MHLLSKIFAFKTVMAIFFLSLTSPAEAQQHVFRGKITNGGTPVQYISVFIKGLNKGVLTDESGEFSFRNVEAGTYEITVSGVGYESQTLQITIPGKSVAIALKSSEHQLEEVVVEGKSDTQLAIENPIKSAVINTQVSARTPSTMIELMNRSAGVRVRQTGGLGSSAGIIVNGFQDRAIRYFKDGIPMDYLGAGYNFSLVPVNQLERLEIYKGVLPVSLGADALGGGINMVTRKPFTKSLETSYEIASFNTHRATLNLYYPNAKQKFFVGMEAFLNHSDNDYSVTPDIIKRKVKLYHNDFTHYYGEIYGGITNTLWADELRIGLTGFWINRQNQYGSSMTQPFGGYTGEQYSIVPTLRYKKTFFKKRLEVDQFVEANTIRVNQVDTAGVTYDWDGNFEDSDSWTGETSLRGSLAKTDFSYFTSRTYLSFAISATQKLEFNAVYSANKRLGKDPLGMTFQGSGRDILSLPAHYNKTVSAIGLESHFFDNKLTNNFIIKYYQYSIEAIDADYYGAEQDRTTDYNRWGVANAIKLSSGEHSFFRISGEFATRLPEQDELFGNGNLHVSNFELRPEKSANINAGYYKTSSDDKFVLELNAFYRKTHDLIINVPYNFLFNQHQNVENVRGIGFETDATYAIRRWLKVNGNFTYQDFRLFDTGNALREDSRLQNTPYFFANLGLHASASKLLSKRDKIDAYWFYSFVREYYLANIPKEFEPDGFLGLWGRAKFDAPNIIPNQNVHIAGFTYFPFGQNLSVGMQLKNIFDTKVYDNFRIQNAGRSFHLKLTYILK